MCLFLLGVQWGAQNFGQQLKKTMYQLKQSFLITPYNGFMMNVDNGWLSHLVTLLVVATEQIKFPNKN
jgi:hypothetical protein